VNASTAAAISLKLIAWLGSGMFGCNWAWALGGLVGLGRNLADFGVDGRADAPPEPLS
jgi:hypothetical protein